jgi:hypothetical protein
MSFWSRADVGPVSLGAAQYLRDLASGVPLTAMDVDAWAKPDAAGRSHDQPHSGWLGTATGRASADEIVSGLYQLTTGPVECRSRALACTAPRCCHHVTHHSAG